MQASRTVDVQDFIDRHRLSRFQIAILALCFTIVAVDGFDTAAIGFIAPAIRAEWNTSPADLAPLFAAGLFGLMIGALLMGPIADRLGRKPVLIFCILFFGAASLGSAFATDLTWLTILRFLTGLGLGGAMPNAITLTSEYCPAKQRSVLVTSMFCGFTLGSALGGLMAAQMVAEWGWRSVLIAGGITPLTLVPILVVMLPESARFLSMRGQRDRQIARILSRVYPEPGLHEATFTGAPRIQGLPVKQLFAPEFMKGTLLLWVTFFMGLLVVYLLSSWLPTLLNTTGASLGTASLVTAMFQIGGTVGAIVLGRLMDKYDPHYVLAFSYGCAAFFVAVFGLIATNPLLLSIAVFAAGFGISGGQVGINALAANYYPTASRATGVSWANAVGRTGSVVGSMAGGAMLAVGLSLPILFAVVSLPAFIGAVAIAAKGAVGRTALPLSPAKQP